MPEIIDIIDRRQRRARSLSAPIPLRGPISVSDGVARDALGRGLRDLRISVTDACNFRCRYCMPKEKFSARHRFLTHSELLSFNEIARLARAFMSLGVRKIKLTGGEPLLRRGLADLVAQLKTLRGADGRAPEVTLTTNATLLARQAEGLRQAGLDRVTVSLDAITEKVFQGINDVGFTVARVLEGIDAAKQLGFTVKINTVLMRGVNEGEALPILERFRGSGVTVRFIEYMDAGTANDWHDSQVVPTAELIETIGARWPLEPIGGASGGVAELWRFSDGAGEVGFISSVTRPFCSGCTRARVSVEGGLFLCLFAGRGYDLRVMLRGGATDEEIMEAVARVWTERRDRYSELRGQGKESPGERVEMQYIGG